jgi:hypothetical protein
MSTVCADGFLERDLRAKTFEIPMHDGHREFPTI